MVSKNRLGNWVTEELMTFQTTGQIGAPVISVCIANYNGMGMIDECIASVLDQAQGLDVEVLVHDDASIDGSASYISAQYPQVLLIVSPQNVGFCVSNNRMVAEARGRYVLLLNNDAVLMDGALHTLLDGARKLGQPGILTLPQYDYEFGSLVDRGCFLDPFYNPVPNLNSHRQDVAMVIGACLWIDREFWNELGGFPEWFGSIAEDMYLCCRARLAGNPVQVMSTSGYRHRQGVSFGGNKPKDSRLSSTYKRRFLSERNKMYVMMIMTPKLRLAWLLPLHSALSLLETLTFCLALTNWDYASKVQWPAWRDIWKQRAKLRQEHAKIMTLRRVSLAEFLKVFIRVPRKLTLLWQYGLPTLR